MFQFWMMGQSLENFRKQGVVTVNGKQVVQADLKASNGVIHVVEQVIYPLATANIAQLVTSDGRFSTLLAAVGAAGTEMRHWRVLPWGENYSKY